jgi:hypothetical protein
MPPKVVFMPKKCEGASHVTKFDFGIINKQTRQCWKHKSGSNQPVNSSNKMTESNSKVIANAMQSKRKYIRKISNQPAKENFIKKAKRHMAITITRVLYVECKNSC